MTPMTDGLRVGGSVEFAGVNGAPNYARADKQLEIAWRTLPGLNAEGHTQWMGCRPTLPDELPVIGPAPRHHNAYFAFGHGQVGLTNAAITGALIADCVAGRTPRVNLGPYRAARF